MAELYPQPKQQYFDLNGNPLVGGFVYTYAAGSVGTGTPKATYTTAQAGTQNANPVVLDSRGEATIYWDGLYKVILKDSTGALIWTQDYVPYASGSQAALYLPSGTTVSVTKPVFDEYYNVQWAGAVCDGVTDDTTAVNTAANNARAGGFGTLYFPPSDTLTGTVNITGLGYYIAEGGSVIGKPSQDVFAWAAPGSAGYKQPYGHRFYGLVRVNDSVDASASFTRFGAGGEVIGNCGLVFPDPNGVGPNPGTGLVFQTHFTYTVGTANYNKQCGLFTENVSAMYGATIIELNVDIISYGWVDGVAKARSATITSAGNLVTQTAHGYSNGDTVQVLSDGGVYDATGVYTLAGVYTTLPGGLTPRTLYYVVNKTTNTYQLSLTLGGAAITISSDGVACAMAPAGALLSANADEISALNMRFTSTLCSLSLHSHNLCSFSSLTIHPVRVGMRLYFVPNSVFAGGAVLQIANLYSEGPTGISVNDTFMTNKEYMRVEWDQVSFRAAQISPSYATNVFASIVGNGCRAEFNTITYGIVNLLGNRIDASVNSASAPTVVKNYGNNQAIVYGQPAGLYAGNTLDDRALSGAPFGGYTGEWLATNPTTGPYRNKQSLLIPGMNTIPTNGGAYTLSATDTTTTIPGAVVIANAAASFGTWRANYTTSSAIRVGEILPACPGTLYCYAKASTACTVALSVDAYTVGSATVMSLTTAWSLWSCRYTLVGAAAQTQINAHIAAPSVSASVYVNYFLFVPDADVTPTAAVQFSNVGPSSPTGGVSGNLRGGVGAPANAMGSNGDYYFRSDGGASTHIYYKSAGSWAGIV